MNHVVVVWIRSAFLVRELRDHSHGCCQGTRDSLDSIMPTIRSVHITYCLQRVSKGRVGEIGRILFFLTTYQKKMGLAALALPVSASCGFATIYLTRPLSRNPSTQCDPPLIDRRRCASSFFSFRSLERWREKSAYVLSESASDRDTDKNII